MKYLILIFFVHFSLISLAQSNSGIATPNKDSLRTELQALLNITPLKINQVLGCIDSTSLEIKKVASNKSLTVVQKDDKIKSLAKKRDDRIRVLLTEQQVLLLKSYFSQRQDKQKKLLKKG